MKAVTDWTAGFNGRPLSLFFLIVGTVLVLLAVTSGFALPVLKEIVADPNYRIFALFIGLIFVAVGSGNYYFPKRPMPIVWVPDELKGSFVYRRNNLSQTQRVLLSILEDETTLTKRVLDKDIADLFNRRHGNGHGTSELYYRLEQLRLLGFIERQALVAGGPNSYRVSPPYWNELQLAGSPRSATYPQSST